MLVATISILAFVPFRSGHIMPWSMDVASLGAAIDTSIWLAFEPTVGRSAKRRRVLAGALALDYVARRLAVLDRIYVGLFQLQRIDAVLTREPMWYALWKLKLDAPPIVLALDDPYQ